MIRFLAVLSMIFAVAEPAMGNPYCNVCRQRAPVIHKEVKVFKQLLSVTKIYPTYAATFIPPAPIIIQGGATAVGQQAYSVQAQQSYGLAFQQGIAAVQVPNYGAQAQTNGNDLSAILMRIESRMAALEAKCEIAPGKADPFAVKGQVGIPKVFATKCAQCHNATVAEKDGGSFVLFDKGKLAKLGERELRLILTHVGNSTMPPPNNAKKIPSVSDEEAAEVVAWSATQK